MNVTIDLSTILSSLTLAAILYTAATLNRLDKKQALAAQQADTQEREMVHLRARVTTTEAEVASLKIAVASFTAAAGLNPQTN